MSALSAQYHNWRLEDHAEVRITEVAAVYQACSARGFTLGSAAVYARIGAVEQAGGLEA